VACPQLVAIVVPKVEECETLHEADRALAAAKRDHGVEIGTIRLLPLIETALGVVRWKRYSSVRRRGRGRGR
jgi:citrate lyase subunit beta/citryl-CoA lyase